MNSSFTDTLARENKQPCRWEGCLAQFNNELEIHQHLIDSHLSHRGDNKKCQWRAYYNRPVCNSVVATNTNFKDHIM